MSFFSKEKLAELEAREQSQVARPTVMIVDDEEGNLHVMAALLSPYYQLIQASDGQQALTMIEQLGADSGIACIVSDQRMPNLTGVELFQRVHAILPLTVRIIVTGFVDINAIVDSINKAEIYKFIVKPFDAHDFLLTVRRGVESYQMQRRLADYHHDLEEQVRVRTRELEQSRHELIETNMRLVAEVAERQRAEAALRKTSDQILALYNNASCGYHSIDRNGVIVHINDTQLRWLQRQREEVVGKLRLKDLMTCDSWERLREKYPAIERSGWLCDLQDVEYACVAKDGAVIPMLANAVALQDGGDEVARFTVFDITERNQAEERMRYLASHDALTGLPNRTLLHDRLQRDLLQAHRNGRKVALLFIDLDRFKQINDTLGHHVGDQLLCQAALRLKDCVRKSDSVARLGGDEFVISLPDLEGTSVSHVAEKVLDVLATDFDIEGKILRVSGSVGISIYPEDGESIETLMRKADDAMYRAKQAGKNRFVYFADPAD